MGTKVKDIVANQNWTWPDAWSESCPRIDDISIPSFSNATDKLWWLSKAKVKQPILGSQCLGISKRR